MGGKGASLHQARGKGWRTSAEASRSATRRVMATGDQGQRKSAQGPDVAVEMQLSRVRKRDPES